jgi:peptidoglycan hydrolase-like protein with peptidoglycan-binding domain
MTGHWRTRTTGGRCRATVLGMVIAVATLGVMLIVPGVAAAATVADIKLAQTDLNGLDYNAGTVDGIAGSQTQAATSAFQSDQCLSVDGAIGTETIGTLKSVVEQVQTAAGVAADGVYAPSTTAAVRTYQSAHGLTADGIAGPNTTASMNIDRINPSCHNPSGTGAAVVAIAKGEVGTRADANQCVPGKPYSICNEWCAAFATWAWRTAGIDIPFMTYVPTVYDWAVNHGKWYGTGQLALAQPGYLIIFGTATNRYHIGIVDHVSGSTVYVISGNTTNPSNSSQWGVYDKAYPLSGSKFYGLVHL